MSGLIEKAVERVLLGSEPQTQSDMGSVNKIVVCQRGFIYSGAVMFDGEYIVIRDAVNIRRWGTKNGLGQLALSGPTAETTADDCGTVRVHQLAVVAMIDCGERINATI